MYMNYAAMCFITQVFNIRYIYIRSFERFFERPHEEFQLIRLPFSLLESIYRQLIASII